MVKVDAGAACHALRSRSPSDFYIKPDPLGLPRQLARRSLHGDQAGDREKAKSCDYGDRS
jgi:hypothetical protein